MVAIVGAGLGSAVAVYAALSDDRHARATRTFVGVLGLAVASVCLWFL